MTNIRKIRLVEITPFNFQPFDLAFFQSGVCYDHSKGPDGSCCDSERNRLYEKLHFGLIAIGSWDFQRPVVSRFVFGIPDHHYHLITLWSIMSIHLGCLKIKKNSGGVATTTFLKYAVKTIADIACSGSFLLPLL